MEDIGALKKKGRALTPAVRIGQNGLSDSAIEEVKKQLKAKKLIKLKFLPNFMDGADKKESVLELVQKTDSVLIDFIGFTAVLASKEIVYGKSRK